MAPIVTQEDIRRLNNQRGHLDYLPPELTGEKTLGNFKTFKSNVGLDHIQTQLEHASKHHCAVVETSVFNTSITLSVTCRVLL